MKYALAAAILLMAWLASPETQSAALPEALPGSGITLIVGQAWTLPKDGVGQLAIGNPSIARAQISGDGKHIIVTGLRPGQTELTLWDNEQKPMQHSLRIVGGERHAPAKELQDLLGPLENIRLRSVGEQIVVEGEVLRPEDYQRIEQIAAFYPNVRTLVKLKAEVLPVLAQEINRKLVRLGLQRLQAQASGSSMTLAGDALSVEHHDQALKIAQAIFPDVEDFVRIKTGSQPAVRLSLSLFEINRSHLMNLGIRWQDALIASGQWQFSNAGSRWGLSSNPAATLDLVEKKGWGRVLTQPRLLCRSGETAQFHSGGEIPIRLVSERTADLRFKPYGILLKMAPLVTLTGDIALNVDTEISTLDGAHSIEGIPAFLTRKLSTAVTLAPGQSLILGGLTDTNELKNVQRIPGLGWIPGLGELFKARASQDSRMEVLILIQPQIIEGTPDDPSAQNEFNERHKETGSWTQWRWND